MTMDFKSLLTIVADGKILNEEQAEAAFNIMMSGDATPAQIGGFLMALRVRGESISEITGACRVMRKRALHINVPDNAIDIVGTGGTGLHTYNISTAASIVLAGCGQPVAKHGNRALSSKSGTADAFMALGIDLDCDFKYLEQAAFEANLVFLMATRHHSAMRNVGPSRVEMGVRTIFNILGPLSNPAFVKRIMCGAFSKQWIVPMATSLRNVGCDVAWVAHGSDGMDEITTTGVTYIAELRNGKIREFEITPDDAGLPIANIDDLRGGTPIENAAKITNLLDGETGAFRDIVLINAAAGLVIADKADNLKTAVDMAAKSIDSGAAKGALAKLISITGLKKSGLQK